MESQPQNPEFRINPKNFQTCGIVLKLHSQKFNLSRVCLLEILVDELIAFFELRRLRRNCALVRAFVARIHEVWM